MPSLSLLTRINTQEICSLFTQINLIMNMFVCSNIIMSLFVLLEEQYRMTVKYFSDVSLTKKNENGSSVILPVRQFWRGVPHSELQLICFEMHDVCEIWMLEEKLRHRPLRAEARHYATLL